MLRNYSWGILLGWLILESWSSLAVPQSSSGSGHYFDSYLLWHCWYYCSRLLILLFMLVLMSLKNMDLIISIIQTLPLLLLLFSPDMTWQVELLLYYIVWSYNWLLLMMFLTLFIFIYFIFIIYVLINLSIVSVTSC